MSYADSDGNGDIDAQNEIIEENNYYPFGLEHKGYNNVVNGTDYPFGYNGKEENDELGLNWLDLGARNHDPALGRFMNLDPLAEDYYFQSTYAFAANNPIFYVDINGEGVENDYGLDKKTGKITLIKETDDTTDTLYAGTGEGESFVKDESKGSVTVDQYKDGNSIISGLSDKNTVTKKWLNQDDIEKSRDENITTAPNGYGKEAYNVFKFAADNSDVEWSLQSYSVMPGAIDYQIGTYHDRHEAPSLKVSSKIATLLSSIHSHPGQPTKSDRKESLWGDRGLMPGRVKKWGNNFKFYVYFPNTGKTDELRYKGKSMGRHIVKTKPNVNPKLKL